MQFLSGFHDMYPTPDVAVSVRPATGGSGSFGNAVRFVASLLAAFFFAFSSNASAEGRCPPGMFETGSRDFIACAPLPGYGQSGNEGDYQSDTSSQRPSGPQYAESSMATAVHMDSSEVWGTAGHRSKEAAKKRVMDACAAAMGDGCIYSEAWTGNIIIAVAVDGGGGVWPEGAERKSEAEKEALAACEKMAREWGCKIALGFRNVLIPASADQGDDYSEDYFPQGPVKRRSWALLAQPAGVPSIAWQRKTWLLSGRNNWVAAKEELVARCQADTGMKCSFGVGVADGVLIHYVNRLGQTSWLNAAGAATPEARVAGICTPDEMPCRILALYDAATPRLQVISEPEPTRGYMSVAWATRAGWPRLAIVTGRPTLAAANADAIRLCESQSQLTCELFLENPDNRTSMFMGLYQLPEDQLHLIRGYSIEDVKQKAAEASAKNNLPYTNRAFVDLYERGETTPLYKD